MDKVCLIDGYGLIYRCYFAFIRNPLHNSRGENISAVFGFMKTILNLLNEKRPSHIVILFDSITPTFRHEKFPEYKQNRDKTPDDLISQINQIEKLLELWKFPFLRVNGFEADDLIATLAKRANKEGKAVEILSADKDLLQLVNDLTTVIKLDKKEWISKGVKGVREEWGFEPIQIIDYLALLGDSADNIPGVKGIGKKTALELVSTFGSLENIYNNLDEIRERWKRLLLDGKEAAFLSKDLIILEDNVPTDFVWEDSSFSNGLKERESVAKFLLDLEIPSIAKELNSDVSDSSGGLFEEEVDKTTASNYELILTEEQLLKWCKRIRDKGICAFDSETTGLDDMVAEPVGFSFSIEQEEGCYIPIRSSQSSLSLSADFVKKELKNLLEDESVKVIGQNLKYDYKILKRWGIDIANLYFDTMIAAWLIDSSNPVNMDSLALRYLNIETIHFEDIVPSGASFMDVDLKLANHYASEDADITWRLFELFKEKLTKNQLDKIFFEIEMPLVRVLSCMELTGIYLDANMLAQFNEGLTKEIEQLTANIYELAKTTFNINSTKQLQQILFEDLNLPTGKKTKTGYSTDTAVLENLLGKHPIIKDILRYRTLNKLQSTYVQALPKVVNSQTKRVHTHYLQIGVATGRLSSQDPNLQNIPIKDELGRTIRKAFKAREGFTLLSADYSQIELVVLAHLCEDGGLMRAFRDKVDIHRLVASRLMGCREEDVLPDMRRVAKSINFGVIYGMSAFRLARDLGLRRQDADRFIDAYFTQFSGIKRFIEKSLEKARERGWTETMMGRRRYFPLLESSNRTERGHAERAAVNSIIQGSAADLMKIAMIKVFNSFKRKNLKSRILLQVHDELVCEVHEDEKEIVKKIVNKEMSEAIALKVPLTVSIEWGNAWGDMH